MSEEDQIALAIQMSMNDANPPADDASKDTPTAMETDVRDCFQIYLLISV